ncbi:hypothetical protein Ari01nite_94890 [Paractinoplanes rishiriensis]|uniref:Uncharacterized protein n=1 Tax=Paractinoplanes rishiriensis TaxID=1050105 RepID=A0A919N029_9ACTN|nr:hypothetical protein Ari01nite_94890 [Actinoplanes rishiriensis]
MRPPRLMKVRAVTSAAPWPRPATPAHSTARPGAASRPSTATSTGRLATTAPRVRRSSWRSSSGMARPPRMPMPWNRNRCRPAVRSGTPFAISMVGSQVTRT